MNNNQVKIDPTTGDPLIKPGMMFDPITGELLNVGYNNGQNAMDLVNENKINQQINIQNVQPQPQYNIQQSNEQNISDQNYIQNQFQSIPTVDQTKQEFINNTQMISKEKSTEKKESINYAFVIILFAIIFISIFFIFPLLLKYI